ncbi:alkaline phosphatase [Bacteroidota bacterium]
MIKNIIFLLLAASVLISCEKKAKKAEYYPKNIILMISDGCGENHILATNYFIDGEAESQPYQQFDVKLFMSTYPAITSKVQGNNDIKNYNTGYSSEPVWTDYKYVMQGYTGSSAAATAMYTGKKTAMLSVSVALDSSNLKTIADRAFELGKSIGVVSSVQYSHATPACLGAHNINRQNYVQIANEMIIDSKLSVIMGCGNPYYNGNAELSDTVIESAYTGGIGTWNNLKNGVITFDSTTVNGNNIVQDIDGDEKPDPWILINDSMDFVNLADGKTPKRVIGIPNVNLTLQVARRIDERVEGTLPFEFANNKNVPLLEDMTKAALNILDNNKNGFLVMIEGGAIDWAAHANVIERVIEEENDFNNSVKAVMQWVEENSNWDETLLIVTADHETGYLVGPDFPGEDMINNFNVTNNGKGKLPGYKFLSGSHTNHLVPLYAKGAGSELFKRYADEVDYNNGDYINNTEIAQTVFTLWDGYENAKPNIEKSQLIK